MTLKEKFFAIYKKVYKTDKEPNSFELAKLANVLANAMVCCADAEQELGTDVFNALKKCVKVRNRSTKVDITALMKLLNNE